MLRNFNVVILKYVKKIAKNISNPKFRKIKHSLNNIVIIKTGNTIDYVIKKI